MTESREQFDSQVKSHIDHSVNTSQNTDKKIDHLDVRPDEPITDQSSSHEDAEDPTSDLQRLLAFSEAFASYLTVSSKMAILEATYSIEKLPKLILSNLLLLPFFLVFWLGVSFTISLYVYETFASLTLSGLSFSIVQLLAILCLILFRHKVKSKIGFRKTRENISIALEVLKSIKK